MPIYEYKCESCDRVHEIWQKITDEPLRYCPDCMGAVHKQVSISAFHLKGGGWFANGYADSNVKSEQKTSDNLGSAQKKTESKCESVSA